MFRFFSFVICSVCLFFPVRAAVFAADISPYLDSETIAVVKVNLKQLDLPGIQKYFESTYNKAIEEILPANDPLKSQMLGNMITGSDPVVNAAQTVYRDLVTVGKAEEVYIIAYRDALMETMFPALLAIPVPKGASQDQIDKIRMQYLNGGIPVTFVRHGFIVGIPVIPQFSKQKEIMAFAREKFKEPSTQSRTDIASLLDAQPDALLQIAVGRIDQFQEDVESKIEGFKPLLRMTMEAEEWKKADDALKMVPTVFQSLDSFHFIYNHVKPEIKVVIRLKDENFAETIYTMYSESLKETEASLDKLRIQKDYFDIDPENPGLTQRQLDALKHIYKVFQFKRQGNEVVGLYDSSGMEALKTAIIELLVKPNIVNTYRMMKTFGNFGPPR